MIFRPIEGYNIYDFPIHHRFTVLDLKKYFVSKIPNADNSCDLKLLNNDRHELLNNSLVDFNECFYEICNNSLENSSDSDQFEICLTYHDLSHYVEVNRTNNLNVLCDLSNVIFEMTDCKLIHENAILDPVEIVEDKLEDRDEVFVIKHQLISLRFLDNSETKESIQMDNISVLLSLHDLQKQNSTLQRIDSDLLFMHSEGFYLMDDLPIYRMNIESRDCLHYHLPQKNQVELVTEKQSFREGQFSKLFKARSGSATYAVKKYDLQESNKSRMGIYKAIRREIYHTKTVGQDDPHPHIVRLIGINVVNRHVIHIVMEYIEYKAEPRINSIRDYLDNDYTLTYQEIRQLIQDIISGTKHLHARYLIHRNLKCSSILLTPDKRAKLTSLNVSRYYLSISSNMDELRKFGDPGSELESNNWLAPEVQTNQLYSEKSDVFSIGCTAAEMKDGEFPSKNPKFLSSPQGEGDTLLWNFVSCCTERDADSRYNLTTAEQHPFLRTE